jgi:thiol-disulfide isomerase/thioredoxin
MPRWTPLLPILVASLSVSALHAEVQFVNRPLSVVKEMASREGKLYFVHFTAQWCMPCRWMDENTFSDPAVSDYVQEHYLAVKMDIDDPYGLRIKEELGVKLLPTILVFNSKGELLERRESSIGAEPFLALLQQYNLPGHRSRTYPASGHGAHHTMPPIVPAAPQETIVPGGLSRPALIPEEAPTRAQPVITPAVAYSSAPMASVQYMPGAEVPFTVQTGVFSDYSNALAEVNRLESLLRRPVSLTGVSQNGKTVYKITIGSFSSRQTAEDYNVYLKGKSIAGFVRAIDSL